MKQLSLHPHLETLFALWADPHDAARAMSQTVTDDFLDHVFIVETAEAAPPLRVSKAGGALNAIFEGGLRGQDLLRLFARHEQALLWGLLNTIKAKGQPALVRIKARAEAAAVDVDLALAPLGGGPETLRWLGFYQPNGPLRGPVRAQEIVAVHLGKPARRGERLNA